MSLAYQCCLIDMVYTRRVYGLYSQSSSCAQLVFPMFTCLCTLNTPKLTLPVCTKSYSGPFAVPFSAAVGRYMFAVDYFSCCVLQSCYNFKLSSVWQHRISTSSAESLDFLCSSSPSFVLLLKRGSPFCYHSVIFGFSLALSCPALQFC